MPSLSRVSFTHAVQLLLGVVSLILLSRWLYSFPARSTGTRVEEEWKPRPSVQRYDGGSRNNGIQSEELTTGGLGTKRWSTTRITSFLLAHPNRAYFSRLFRDGGFKKGIEIGVADGRFSEHFLKDNRDLTGWSWTMIEPFPNEKLQHRLGDENSNFRDGTWSNAGLLNYVNLIYKVDLSMKRELLDTLPDGGYDFIYLDGDHRYEVVKKEMPVYWAKVKSGGVLAGHDYCNYGERGLGCNGCRYIPACAKYTEYGVAHGKRGERVANENGVVRAVQEWLVSMNKIEPELRIYFTLEDFTRDSFAQDGMDYDVIITSTRNPSWFLVKP